jgi:hypothetical protein
LLVLASERCEFFAGQQQLGVTPETAGTATARLFGGVVGEVQLQGAHLAVVQSCATGADLEFIATLRPFVEDSALQGGGEDFSLLTMASAETVTTSIAQHGPPLLIESVESVDGLAQSVLFVLSSPRSGSSLLQLCLQVNQALYAGQELHLLQFATIEERRSRFPFELLEGLVKTVVELWSRNLGDAAEKVAEWEEQSVPVWSVFGWLLSELAGCRILVDKSPSYIDHPSYLDHAQIIFGHTARYVHLVRHPYTCVQSGVELLVKYIRNDAVNLTRGGDPDLAWPIMEHGWVAGQTHANAFLKRLEHGAMQTADGEAQQQTLLIFFEDLVCKPEQTLLTICQLVDIAFDHDMTEPYQTEAIETFRSAQSVSTTDPKLLRRQTIEKSQADKWRQVKLPQPLSEEAEELARGFSYNLDQTW